MRRRPIEVFSISFLDLLSGALGAVIILYVAIPKNAPSDSLEKKNLEIINRKLSETEFELAKTKVQLNLAKEKLSKIEVPQKKGGVGDKDLDIGFKFKGKEILFLIDTSYSMHEEERMAQVKAGLKMLITSLSKEYKFDVIQFPLVERAPFKSLWGVQKENSHSNQMDLFDFIFNLHPAGGTPTREALLFALENYENISDIVLLTDGEPTLHNSNTKDDIYDIIRVVREKNENKVQINSIGVGSQMVKDKTSPRYNFLRLLSEETNGFFVGF